MENLEEWYKSRLGLVGGPRETVLAALADISMGRPSEEAKAQWERMSDAELDQYFWTRCL